MAVDFAPLNILLASSEVIGFAKTGGLADVSGYLPRALARLGHNLAIIQPLYRCVRYGPNPIQATEFWLPVPIGGQIVPTRLWKTKLPHSEVPVYLVENAELFERDDASFGRGLYQFNTPDGGKLDYPDNAAPLYFFLSGCSRSDTLSRLHTRHSARERLANRAVACIFARALSKSAGL